MKKLHLVVCTALGAFGAIGCTSTDLAGDNSKNDVRVVRTTAYSHQEADSLPYGLKSARGTNLKYGRIRSAAADWSVYPVGTLFKIEGEPYIYEVDDYGSALVGTETIDLYRPSISSMNNWGVRHVPIEVLRWGSYEQSLDILRPRTSKASHVRKMANSIEKKT